MSGHEAKRYEAETRRLVSLILCRTCGCEACDILGWRDETGADGFDLRCFKCGATEAIRKFTVGRARVDLDQVERAKRDAPSKPTSHGRRWTVADLGELNEHRPLEDEP